MAMATFYEVWDDGTGNRVGGAFATRAEAEALLGDVLRVNGEDAASEMAILACTQNEAGKVRRTTVLEGTEFLERSSGTPPIPGGVTGSVEVSANAPGVGGSVALGGTIGSAVEATGYLPPDILSTVEQATRVTSNPSYEALIDRTFATGAAQAAWQGIPSAADVARFGMGSVADQISAVANERRQVILGELQALEASRAQLGAMAQSVERMMAGIREAYEKPLADLQETVARSMAHYQEGLAGSVRAIQEAMAQYDLAELERRTSVLAAIRDLDADPFSVSVDSSLRAIFDQQAQTWLNMNGQEFIERYEAGELPADEDDPDEPKKIAALATLSSYVRRAA